MRTPPAQPGGWRLQYILIIGFVLTAVVTIVVGALLIHNVITSYLDEAQDARVERDMDLAEAFYNNKMNDLRSAAGRISAVRSVRHSLSAAHEGDCASVEALNEAVVNEIENQSPGTQRFVVVTDAQRHSVTG